MFHVMFHLQMFKMVSVYARTPSNEVPQNDRNIENGRFSEIIFDFFTQSKFNLLSFTSFVKQV